MVYVKEIAVVNRPTTTLTALVILAAVSIVSVQASRAGEGIVAAGAEIATLADGFKFTEGPACDAEGNVFFTDQPNDRIMKWSVDGELSTFMKPCGRSNGLYFDGDGRLCN